MGRASDGKGRWVGAIHAQVSVGARRLCVPRAMRLLAAPSRHWERWPPMASYGLPPMTARPPSSRLDLSYHAMTMVHYRRPTCSALGVGPSKFDRVDVCVTMTSSGVVSAAASAPASTPASTSESMSGVEERVATMSWLHW